MPPYELRLETLFPPHPPGILCYLEIGPRGGPTPRFLGEGERTLIPDFNDLIKRLSTARGLTAAIVLVLLAFIAWWNIDFISEVSFTLKKPDGRSEAEPSPRTELTRKDDESGVPGLELGEVIVPPAPRELPSIVAFQIRNGGTATTRQVRVSVDFGSARVISYEVLGPKADEVSGSEPGSSVINVELTRLDAGETAYLYAHTSHPEFKTVTLSSNSTIPVIRFTYSDFLAGRGDSGSFSFGTFLLILLGLFMVAMTIFAIHAVVEVVGRWLKLE